ncbi:RsbRD N-terminal domain-containing protein [Nannocystis pusilla]|uniref:RsbRD N-terminal domain-containing protein n=1 Tax=Nannocystis pusilla TaxID=889268 RepID=UPI003DA4C573
MNFVQHHHQEILHEWAIEARKAASARGLSDLELNNMIPLLLASLTGGAEWEALARHIESHLGDRIRRGFEMAEIVEEFAILQRCIADCARNSPSAERPSEEELARIFVTLQSTMVRTADVFQEHMRLDEQQEKRYLRMLRTLADAALRAPRSRRAR